MAYKCLNFMETEMKLCAEILVEWIRQFLFCSDCYVETILVPPRTGRGPPLSDGLSDCLLFSFPIVVPHFQNLRSS